MKKGFVLKASLIVVVILFASLTTARAHQIWTENGARASLNSAQAAAHSALLHARSDGLLPAELAPYAKRNGSLAAQRAPGNPTFWSSERADFYTAQTLAYRKLTRDIVAGIQRVTVETRRQAQTAISALNGDITTARSLDLDTRTAASTVSTQTVALDHATTPLLYRRAMANVTQIEAALTSAIKARQAYVNSQVAAAHGSTAGVLRSVDNEVAAAHDQLSLIALLSSRATAEGKALDALAATAHAQTTPNAAAVKAYEVHQEALLINADYRKTVPEKLVLVSTENQSATMYENGKVVYSTPVTTGGPELPTDIGVFHIYMKASPFEFHSPWPPGSPYYYAPTPVTFWMPFDGAEGLHDASWRSNFGPGSNLQPTDLGTGNYILGTHGCVNLPYDAAQFVWDWAPIGTTVVVV